MPPISRRHFMFGTLLTDAIAVRFDGKLLWDNARGEITNNKEANKLVRPLYRKRWEVKL
jgi:hypothetical protein